MPLSMYDGKVELEYDPKAHAYAINGIPVPSVTKITGVIDKPALVHWAVNEMESALLELWQPGREYTEEQIKHAVHDSKSARFRTSQDALHIGSQAHAWVEAFIKSRIYGYPTPPMPSYEPVKIAASSFLDWTKEHEVAFLSSERKVCSLEYMYSGTVDVVAVIDGKNTVVDLKTAKGIYPEYFLQCAAYAVALSEETGNDYGRVAIVRIPKVEDDSLEVGSRDDVGDLFDVFKGCLSIWRWQNNWGVQSD